MELKGSPIDSSASTALECHNRARMKTVRRAPAPHHLVCIPSGVAGGGGGGGSSPEKVPAKLVRKAAFTLRSRPAVTE